MKLLAVVLILLLGSFFILERTPPNTIVVNYCYSGANNDFIKQGIEQWKPMKNVKFLRTNKQNFTTLKILEVSSSQMSNSHAFGEYDFFLNIIRLNADKQLTKKQWTAVVSHEVGHYFLLQHDDNTSSIMSNNLNPNSNDILRASKNVGKLSLINKVRGCLDPLYLRLFKSSI